MIASVENAHLTERVQAQLAEHEFASGSSARVLEPDLHNATAEPRVRGDVLYLLSRRVRLVQVVSLHELVLLVRYRRAHSLALLQLQQARRDHSAWIWLPRF